MFKKQMETKIKATSNKQNKSKSQNNLLVNESLQVVVGEISAASQLFGHLGHPLHVGKDGVLRKRHTDVTLLVFARRRGEDPEVAIVATSLQHEPQQNGNLLLWFCFVFVF